MTASGAGGRGFLPAGAIGMVAVGALHASAHLAPAALRARS